MVPSARKIQSQTISIHAGLFLVYGPGDYMLGVL